MVVSPPPAAVKTHDSSASAGAGTSEPEVALSDQRESATVEKRTYKPGHETTVVLVTLSFTLRKCGMFVPLYHFAQMEGFSHAILSAGQNPITWNYV